MYRLIKYLILATLLTALYATGVRFLEGVAAAEVPYRAVTVAQGLEHPWGMTFLPDGQILVTERPGRLRIVSADGKVSPPVEGLPPIAAVGQGGMLDVTLHPNFTENRLVFISLSRNRVQAGRERLLRAGGSKAMR